MTAFSRRILASLAATSLVVLSVPARAEFTTNVAGDVGLDNDSGKEDGLNWVDLNSDGNLDVIVNTASNTRIYLHDGSHPDPGFTDVTSSIAPALLNETGARSIVAVDWNKDGLIDIVRKRYQRL
jgi:hypothetical protein